MRSLLCTLAFFAAAALPLAAQELLPAEKAREIARQLNDSLPREADAGAPAINPDFEHPQGAVAGKVGLMVVPDNQLSSERLAGLGTEVLPLGQLWVREAALARQGTPIAFDQLRNDYLTIGDEPLYVQLYTLAAAKNAEGQPELLVFGKAAAPVARVPLTEINAPTQMFPLEMAGERTSNDSGVLTINIVGRHAASLRLVRPPQ